MPAPAFEQDNCMCRSMYVHTHTQHQVIMMGQKSEFEEFELAVSRLSLSHNVLG